jgi:hypothetical protein
MVPIRWPRKQKLSSFGLAGIRLDATPEIVRPKRTGSPVVSTLADGPCGNMSYAMHMLNKSQSENGARVGRSSGTMLLARDERLFSRRLWGVVPWLRQDAALATESVAEVREFRDTITGRDV